VPTSEISYPVYTTDHTAVMPDACTKSANCASKMCVFTNETSTDDQGVKVCCAWDLYLSMGSNSDDNEDEVSAESLLTDQ
jgi:hypothetical protein